MLGCRTVGGHRGEVEILEDAERHQRGDALAVGRDLVNRDAAIVQRERRDPVGRVIREVRERVCRIDRLRVTRHRFGELAAVERVAVGLRDLRQRARERLARPVLAGHRRPSARHEMLEPAQVARHVRHGQRPFLGDDRRHGEAVARVADRGLEEIRERQLAEALRQRAPAGHGTRNGHRLPAALGHGLAAREARRIPRGRRAARRVESDELAAGPQDREQIGAEPVAAGLDDRQRDRGGERRVDRVAALGEHRDARLRGERLRRRDDVAREDGLAPRRIGQLPVEALRVGCVGLVGHAP